CSPPQTSNPFARGRPQAEAGGSALLAAAHPPRRAPHFGAMDKARPLWDTPLQFVFACISYAVGLGNVWRFPYLCQMYGGGSFLVPYLLMLVVEGMPLLYLELAVGQRMRQGSIGAWRAISPYLGGVGVASVVVSFFLSMYYNVVNAWAFWYLFHSFQVSGPTELSCWLPHPRPDPSWHRPGLQGPNGRWGRLWTLN
uniref:Transporter n=1 Tax=Catagonus wagneri TaxID=51154 RepID=A0A8C3X4M3_9CETA